MTYSERLTVPWWAWPVGLAATAMLAAELAIGAFALRQPLTFAVAAAVTVVALLFFGRIRIRIVTGEVTDDPSGGPELRVDDARLPLWAAGAVTIVDGAGRRDLLGVDADPLAFVIQRPWIQGGVRIELDDPDDPTPYWFVSTRHPQRLAAALKQARPTRSPRRSPQGPPFRRPA